MAGGRFKPGTILTVLVGLGLGLLWGNRTLHVLNGLPVPVLVSFDGRSPMRLEPGQVDYTRRLNVRYEVTVTHLDGGVLETTSIPHRGEYLYDVLGVGPYTLRINKDEVLREGCDSVVLVGSSNGRAPKDTRMLFREEQGGFDGCRTALTPGAWAERAMKVGPLLGPELGAPWLVEGAARLATLDRANEAVSTLQTMVARDDSAALRRGYGRVLRIAGKEAQLLTEYRARHDAEKSTSSLVALAAELRPAEAIALLEPALEHGDAAVKLAAMQAYARAGRHEDVLKLATACVDEPAEPCVIARARALLALSRHDEAFAAIDGKLRQPFTWTLATAQQRVASLTKRKPLAEPFSRLDDAMFHWPPGAAFFELTALGTTHAGPATRELEFLTAFFTAPGDALTRLANNQLAAPPWLPQDLAHLALGEALAAGDRASAHELYKRYVNAELSLADYRSFVCDEATSVDVSHLAPDLQASLWVARARALQRLGTTAHEAAFATAARLDPLNVPAALAARWPPLAP